MEQNSDVVSQGKFISENTYTRANHEIRIDTEDGTIMLDFFDGKTKTVHEIKKSDKMEDVHLWQLKYYLYVLEEKGVEGVTGVIDYPKLKEKVTVNLTEEDRVTLKETMRNIEDIASMPQPPEVVNKPFCKNCSYYELCYI
jgi:CRISPR-associated exonuclease Cas4